MVRYGNLTICKVELDMTVHFAKLVAGFARYNKYTLVAELHERQV